MQYLFGMLARRARIAPVSHDDITVRPTSPRSSSAPDHRVLTRIMTRLDVDSVADQGSRSVG